MVSHDPSHFISGAAFNLSELSKVSITFPSCTDVVASLGSSHSVGVTALLQVTLLVLPQVIDRERKGVLRYGDPQPPFYQILRVYKPLVCLYVFVQHC